MTCHVILTHVLCSATSHGYSPFSFFLWLYPTYKSKNPQWRSPINIIPLGGTPAGISRGLLSRGYGRISFRYILRSLNPPKTNILNVICNLYRDFTIVMMVNIPKKYSSWLNTILRSTCFCSSCFLCARLVVDLVHTELQIVREDDGPIFKSMGHALT